MPDLRDEKGRGRMRERERNTEREIRRNMEKLATASLSFNLLSLRGVKI